VFIVAFQRAQNGGGLGDFLGRLTGSQVSFDVAVGVVVHDGAAAFLVWSDGREFEDQLAALASVRGGEHWRQPEEVERLVALLDGRDPAVAVEVFAAGRAGRAQRLEGVVRAAGPVQPAGVQGEGGGRGAGQRAHADYRPCRYDKKRLIMNTNHMDYFLYDKKYDSKNKTPVLGIAIPVLGVKS